MDHAVYELFAIRYATRPARRRDNFLDGDSDAPMPMDYFTFLARNAQRAIAIDTGFSAKNLGLHGRVSLCSPIDTLKALGVDPETVTDVVLTHLHNDHAGNLHRFPNARFHIQEREMRFVASPGMAHPPLARHYDIDDVVDVIRLNAAGRVKMHDGEAEIMPGIRVGLTGGHAAGLQYVAVTTRRGPVVVAGDIAHFYENIAARRPFPAIYHLGEMLDAFTKVIEVAPSPDHVVPGHDPLVMRLYPAARPDLAGIVARLDVAPLPQPPA